MDRRELLKSMVAVAATMAAGSALAEEHSHGHAAHDHGGHAANPHQKLIEAAADCVVKAELCLQHCLVAMGKGETDLASCANSASQVEAVCTALQKLAAANSKHLAEFAQAAMAIFKDCEDECKKTDQHPECKACGESCAACYKACKQLVG